MKRKHYHLFLIILLLNINTYGQSNTEKEPIRTEWSTIEYKERNVEFLLPEDNYKISNDTLIDPDFGNVEKKSWTLTRSTSKSELLSFGYTFTHSKYPDYKIEKNKIDEYLQFGTDNMIEMTNGNLFFNKKISYKGYPGREIYFSIPNSNFYCNTKKYVINNEIYTLTVLTEKENLANISINKFFNSFKITN